MKKCLRVFFCFWGIETNVIMKGIIGKVVKIIIRHCLLIDNQLCFHTNRHHIEIDRINDKTPPLRTNTSLVVAFIMRKF